jgi:CheY-like chemotaxis protein
MRILVVEDEPTIRDLIDDFLCSEGFETFTAANGREAVDIARREELDIVLMDLMLPEMDGVEAAHILRHDPHTESVRIIAMSADSRMLRGMAESDADDVLSKPFNLCDLLDAVAGQSIHVNEVLERSANNSHRAPTSSLP